MRNKGLKDVVFRKLLYLVERVCEFSSSFSFYLAHLGLRFIREARIFRTLYDFELIVSYFLEELNSRGFVVLDFNNLRLYNLSDFGSEYGQSYVSSFAF